MDEPDRGDRRVPEFLGRVLDSESRPIGTCFQVKPAVLVTAWHVVDSIGAGDEGQTVRVDPLAGGEPFEARVERVDPFHDLALLAGNEALAGSVDSVVPSDNVRVLSEVVIVGVADVDDPGNEYRHMVATGTWQGGTTRNDALPLGRIESKAILAGMSGAPVRRLEDGVVVGVLSGRYNSADGWLRDSAWVVRVEELERLLHGAASLTLAERPGLDGPIDVRLVVTETEVRLVGAAVDVEAPHGGISPGLAAAVDDVRRSRARVGGTRSAVDEAARPGDVALGRLGSLMATSFLPEPLSGVFGDLLRDATGRHVTVRLGVEAGGRFAGLPWEALPDPVGGRPLALHPLVNVYRRVPGQTPPRIPGPLRVLVAISSPEHGGGKTLDYERELRNVLAALRAAHHGDAHVRIVPFASTQAIRRALQELPVHVLHLSGHGSPGTLELEDPDGNARQVDADQLVEEAIPPGAMPLVVSLAACYTDAAHASDAPSFAVRLAERGASVVIATETSITDLYATRLFARVYAELAAASTPEAVDAVASARRSVQSELATSTLDRDRRLSLLDEWAVVTVLSAQGSVTVFDPAEREEIVQAGSISLGGLLARDPGEFVGRRREQRRWPVELTGAGVCGFVLHGIGGVGKTTLAAELIRRIGEREPARGLVVLKGELSVDRFFSAVAAGIRRALPAGEAPRQALIAVEHAASTDLPWAERLDWLRSGLLDQVPLLIVLDNFEDNLTDERALRDGTLASLLGEWTSSPGRSRLLITSRFPFSLPESAERTLSFRHVGPLSQVETLKLAWSLPALDRLDEEQLTRIWTMVGGHPRSLEYLDALLSGGEGRFPDIAQRLANALREKLGIENVDAWIAEHSDFDIALAETVTLAADDVLLGDLLERLRKTPQAEALLLGASVYREPVDRNALVFQVGERDEEAASTPSEVTARIADVLSRHGLELEDIDLEAVPAAVQEELAPHLAELERLRTPPFRAPAALGDLIAACEATSLLSTGVSEDEGWMFVHRWTATELERRWAEEGREEELRDAHRRAYEYWSWRVAVWPQDLVADVHDLLEARHHLLEAGEVDEAAALTESVCAQLHDWGAWDDETSLVLDTLVRLGPDSDQRGAWMIHRLGILAHARGDYEEAERRYTQSLEIYEQLGNLAGSAAGYGQLGILAHARGDYEEAERRYTQSLEISEQLGTRAGTAGSYHQLGMLAHDRGDYEEAERRYTQSLEISEQLGNLAGTAGSYHQLGMLAHARGDYEEAERRYTQSLEIKERLGNLAGTATGYHQLGMLAHARGDYDEAQRRYTQSLEIDEQLGNLAGTATSYHQLGILAHDRGDYDEAQRRYTQSLEINEQLGNLAGTASSYHQLGILAHDRGDYDEAEHLYTQSLEIDEQLGNLAGTATSYHQLGMLAHDRGLTEDAIPLQALALLMRVQMALPAAVRDAARLGAYRDTVGAPTFERVLGDTLGADRAEAVLTLLERFAEADAQPGESGEPPLTAGG